MIELPEIKPFSIHENNLEIPDDAMFQSEIISEQIQELSKDISEPLKRQITAIEKIAEASNIQADIAKQEAEDAKRNARFSKIIAIISVIISIIAVLPIITSWIAKFLLIIQVN